MKKLFYFIISATVLVSAIYGCKKPESGEDTLPPEISVKSPRPYPGNEDTYSISYTIKNPVEGVILEVYTEEEWIENLEADEEKISFTLLENKEKDERSGNIELTYEGAEPVNLEIRQKGAGNSRPEIIASEPEEFDFTGGSGTITYSIKNAVDGAELKVRTYVDWVTDVLVGETEINFSVEANTSEEPRTCQMELEYEDAKPLELTIRQGGSEFTGENLSINGTANCYIVSASGDYMFITVKGNSNEPVGTVASAEVLWESFGTDVAPQKGDMIGNVSSSGSTIRFTVKSPMRKGNAVIAAKDASGKILWSWHIWMTDQPEDQVYVNDAGTMMDRNLGATSTTPGDVGAIGLLYQWGRKDPFLGMASLTENIVAKSTLSEWPEPVMSDASTGTVEYATSHPTTFMLSETNNSGTGDWNYKGDNTLWQSTKTIYDPCPPGYRVPEGGESGVWYKALGNKYYPVADDMNSGIDFGSSSANGGNGYKLTDSPVCWYPFTGEKRLVDGVVSYPYHLYYGEYFGRGNYWSCTEAPNIGGVRYAYEMNIANDIDRKGELDTKTTGCRATGQAVRCLKEK